MLGTGKAAAAGAPLSTGLSGGFGQWSPLHLIMSKEAIKVRQQRKQFLKEARHPSVNPSRLAPAMPQCARRPRSRAARLTTPAPPPLPPSPLRSPPQVRLMVALRHPQIVQVLGAVLEGQEPILVMEFMQFGSCHDLVRNDSIELEVDIVRLA